MANQFRAKCCICGEVVEENRGVYHKIRASERVKWPVWSAGNKWVTRHSDCPAPVAETDFHSIRRMSDYKGALARILADAEALRKDREKYFG